MVIFLYNLYIFIITFAFSMARDKDPVFHPFIRLSTFASTLTLTLMFKFKFQEL